MKRNVLNILLLAAAAVVFSSCKDDDDKASNEFKIDGASVSIKSAGLLYDPTPGESPKTGEDIYFHFVTFLSEGLTLTDEGNGPFVSGEGDGLTFGLISSTTDLEPGKYEFTGTDDNAAPFDFFDGSGYYDLNTNDESEFDITGGTVTVSKSGDTYTIDFDGVIDDTAVKLHYSGTLAKFVND